MSPTVSTLLIDDSPMVRLTLRAMLELSGQEVVEADSLAEARSCLEKPFHLFIVDLNLPDGNGLELVPELRAASPRAVVAVLSGQMPTCPPGTIDVILEKGMDPDQLLMQLERALDERRKYP